MTSYSPTDEQVAARDAFGGGTSFVLEAGAGTGKTSTLQLLAETAPHRKGLYLAFNRAIADEARARFPANIVVKTVHALAMHGTGFAYRDRLNKPKIPLYVTANRLGVFGDLVVASDRRLRPTTQASLAMRTVRRFCSTADPTITTAHVPITPGLTPAQQKKVAQHVVPLATKVWNDVSDPLADNFRFEHDHYLKVWALAHPTWPVDFVLYDEAQDANPVVSGMVADQLAHGTQLVAVGDSAQGIYGWRGAVNAMQSFDLELTLPLTRSFRFGPAIADEANVWLELLGSGMRLTGRPDLDSAVVGHVNAPDAVLCRGNGTAIAELFQALDEGVRVGLVGGGDDLVRVARAALDLQAGKTTEVEEFALFASWSEVQEYADSGDDPQLDVLVNVIDNHGPPAIITAINAAAHEQDAERTLSTLHKAKGREWTTVRLAADFSEPRPDDDGELQLPSDDELMVSYVAVTRAKKVLGIGNLDWGRSWLGKPAVAPGEPVAAKAPTVKVTAPPPVSSAHSGKPWTRKLDEALLSQYRSGTPLPLLIAAFRRPEAEIVARVTVLLERDAGPFNDDGTPRWNQQR